jgi:hypothetical protein
MSPAAFAASSPWSRAAYFSSNSFPVATCSGASGVGPPARRPRFRPGTSVPPESSPSGWAALALQPLVPLGVLVLTPAVRPFRWSRLFWTYLVPVLPAAILFDGVVSTLRVYTPDEMLAMGREVGGDEYECEAGADRPAGSPVPVPDRRAATGPRHSRAGYRAGPRGESAPAAG